MIVPDTAGLSVEPGRFQCNPSGSSPPGLRPRLKSHIILPEGAPAPGGDHERIPQFRRTQETETGRDFVLPLTDSHADRIKRRVLSAAPEQTAASSGSATQGHGQKACPQAGDEPKALFCDCRGNGPRIFGVE